MPGYAKKQTVFNPLAADLLIPTDPDAMVAIYRDYGHLSTRAAQNRRIVFFLVCTREIFYNELMPTEARITAMDIRIRPEQPGDIAAIAEINRTAFHDHPHSSHNEHLIVDGLRRSGWLPLSLVAEIEEEVAGHIAFSEVEISDQTAGWFGLGPLSVVKRWRCRGIGTTLVREGLERLRNLGANGCFVLGDPRFYGRFGFVNDPHLLIEGVPQEFCLSLPFTGKRASGVVTYHRIFYTSC